MILWKKYVRHKLPIYLKCCIHVAFQINSCVSASYLFCAEITLCNHHSKTEQITCFESCPWLRLLEERPEHLLCFRAIASKSLEGANNEPLKRNIDKSWKGAAVVSRFPPDTWWLTGKTTWGNEGGNKDGGKRKHGKWWDQGLPRRQKRLRNPHYSEM